VDGLCRHCGCDTDGRESHCSKILASAYRRGRGPPPLSLGLALPGRGNLAKGTPCLSSLASRKTHDHSVGHTFVAHNWFCLADGTAVDWEPTPTPRERLCDARAGNNDHPLRYSPSSRSS
jgi:hypothetical protein